MENPEKAQTPGISPITAKQTTRLSAKRAAMKPNNRRRGRYIVLATVITALGLGAWFGLNHWSRKPDNPLAAAEVVEVRSGTIEQSVNSSGVVVANLEVDIKARGSGEIVKLPFDISQEVKKGDLLCQLDSTDASLAVRSAEAAVAQSTARLAQAKFTLDEATHNLATTRDRNQATLASAKVKAANLLAKAERQKELVSQQLGSREELEAAQTDASAAEADQRAAEIAIEELKQKEIQLDFKREDVRTAEAQLQSDQINLEIQRQQLAYTTVVAPIDGTVSARQVQKGTIVASGINAVDGGTTIMTLSDLSRIFITATVDESDIGGVQVGQEARITVASYRNRIFRGKVVRIATKGVSESNVVTFEVKVEVLDDDKNLLKPQMTGNVTIIQSRAENVLMVSASAITTDGQKKHVTTIDGKTIPVTTGVETSDAVEITSGVSAGQKLVLTIAELPTKWRSESDPGPPH